MTKTKKFDHTNINKLLQTKALDEMHAERIGHGYKVVDDPDLYERCRKENIHFEVCPLSSVKTGSVPDDLDKHPLHR